MDDLPDSTLGDRGHSRPRCKAYGVVGSEQASAAGLPGNRCCHRVCIAFCGGRCLSAIPTLAPVIVADQNTTVTINRDIEEIEQVAYDIGAAASQDTASLHRGVWSRIRCRPVQPPVKRVGNVKVPEAGEIGCVGVASPRGRSVVSNCSATGSAGNSGREGRIVYAVNRADIENIVPGDTKVVRGGNSRGCAGIGKRKINSSGV